MKFRIFGSLPLYDPLSRIAEGRSDVWRTVIVVGTAARFPKTSVGGEDCVIPHITKGGHAANSVPSATKT